MPDLPSGFPIYEQHELSAAWPVMSPADFDNLKASIAAVGLIEPITIYEKKVLDGFHRYKACIALGKQPEFTDYTGDDPVGFVIAQNNDRRHISAMDRAKAVVRCREWAAPARAGEPFTPPSKAAPEPEDAPPPSTVPAMAREAQVSPTTLKRAKRQVAAERGDAPPPAPSAPRQPAGRPLGPAAVRKLKDRIDTLEGEASAAQEEADKERRRRQLLEDWKETEAKNPESMAAAYEQLNTVIAERDQARAEAAGLRTELRDAKKEIRRLEVRLDQAQRAAGD